MWLCCATMSATTEGDAPTPPPPSDDPNDDLLALDQELSTIEKRLQESRSSSSTSSRALVTGRAAHDSVTDALGDLRRRVDLLGGGGGGDENGGGGAGDRNNEGLLRSVSRRLRTATLAHSSRVPLGLMRGSDDAMATERRSTRERVLSSLREGKVEEQAPNEDAKKSGEGGDPSSSSSRPPLAASTERGGTSRRSSSFLLERGGGSSGRSTLVASRSFLGGSSIQMGGGGDGGSSRSLEMTGVGGGEGFEIEMHGDVPIVSMVGPSPPPERHEHLSPVPEEPPVGNSRASVESSDGSGPSPPPAAREEVPVLLTGSQSRSFSLRRSGRSLGGGSVAEGSILLTPSFDPPEEEPKKEQTVEAYSWGCRAAESSPSSLHDDANPRADPTASRIGPKSRLARPGAPAVASASLGPCHAAVATIRGEVLTCGSNDYGRVAPNRRDLDVVIRPTLLEALGGTRVVGVSCGYDHTAAVTSEGIVLTWGRNDRGQLGHRLPFRRGGTDDDDSDDVPRTFVRPQAMAMKPGRKACAVSCGDGFTLVLTTRMSVLACGIPSIAGGGGGGQGEEGSGGQQLRRLASSIPALEGLPLVSIEAGKSHAIATTVHGTAFAWGDNGNGRCGRPYPSTVSVPMPVLVPMTEAKVRMGAATSNPFPNWAVWDGSKVDDSENDKAVSLADDAAIVDAACGATHTVFVTRSGRLLACGSNDRGQIGGGTGGAALPIQPKEEGGEDDGAEATPPSPPRPIEHPIPGRRFVAAEAGENHTVVLDDVGDVWQMGGGDGNGAEAEEKKKGGIERVLEGRKIRLLAAGGGESVAVAADDVDEGGAAGDSSPDPTDDDGDDCLEGLLKELRNPADDDGDDPTAPDDDHGDPARAAEDLANRTEELLRHPSVLNGLFLDPSELRSMYPSLVAAGGNVAARKAVAKAVERGAIAGLRRLRDGDDDVDGNGARLIYPEQVRCLLLYVQFFDRTGDDECCDPENPDDDGEEIVAFDERGEAIELLCETILGLPFEGYRALLTWATTLYRPDGLYASSLVRPLLHRLNRSLEVRVDDDGVMHPRRSRRAVPLIVAVLRWLYNASERVRDGGGDGNGGDGIAKPEDFYSDAVSAIPTSALYDDLRRMKESASKSSVEAGFYLCANPFLLSPGTKRNLLQLENQVEMIKVAAGEEGARFDRATGELTINPFWKLEIDRENMLKETLDVIRNTETTHLRKKLAVVFKGEEGIDAGGVTKEFFQLISERLFDVTSGMWTDRYGEGITWFNSDCTWEENNYELTGVLVGLALYNSVLLDVRFPGAVYRKLLGLPLGLEDMVDASLGAGLRNLLSYEGDDVEDVFCLNFEVTWTDLGKEQKVELKPGGSDVPVTSENREEYVLLYVKWLLVDSVEPQWDAFERGVKRVMDGSSLGMFRPEELELLVVGTPELDFDALRAKTEYEGGYDEESAVVQNFWTFVKLADRERQIQFLKFATGSSMAPIGGLGELGFKIQRAGPDSPQLPTSHTCFNTLLLPDYGDDYDKLAERLGRAIVECEGFGLQ